MAILRAILGYWRGSASDGRNKEQATATWGRKGDRGLSVAVETLLESSVVLHKTSPMLITAGSGSIREDMWGRGALSVTVEATLRASALLSTPPQSTTPPGELFQPQEPLLQPPVALPLPPPQVSIMEVAQRVGARDLIEENQSMTAFFESTFFKNYLNTIA